MKLSPRTLSALVVAGGFFAWLVLAPSYRPILTPLAILLHELGHLAGARLLGLRVSGFQLAPGEARISLSGRLVTYGQELGVCLAGPAVNLICAALAYGWGGRVLAPGATSFFLTVSLGLGLLNLLPVGDLDGGRILRCIIERMAGPRVADGILEWVSFLCLFVLWCFSVYTLMRTGDSLSLFLFSASLFTKLFTGKTKNSSRG